MLLAGDVGGTKTRIGLYRRSGAGGERPEPVLVRQYLTLDFDSLDDVVERFLDESDAREIDAVSVGVAGPVTGLVARLTNVPWLADATPLADRLDDCPVELINDLEALAWAVPVLEADELAILQEGIAVPSGNAALIAAGTGLGEALLHNVDGTFVPSASEGGHADFAPRTRRELALVEELLRVHGRVDNERVISGPGLVNVFRFTHGSRDVRAACHAVGVDADETGLPARISQSAMARRCEACVEALDMFMEAYGAEAGNVALRTMATAGIYLGGGIAPKILSALERGPFLDGFCSKPPMTDLLRMLPVSVILNPLAGLLGAAVRASRLASATSA